MNKYIVVGVLCAAITGFSITAGTALATYIQSGTVVASILGSAGKEEKITKIVDGAVTCYVMAEQFPAISCVK